MKKFENLESEFEDLKKSLLKTSSGLYVHHITLTYTTVATVCLTMITNSSTEFTTASLAEYLFAHNHTSRTTGIVISGGYALGTSGLNRVYQTIYSTNGSNLRAALVNGEAANVYNDVSTYTITDTIEALESL